jgi:hypothetical protein
VTGLPVIKVFQEAAERGLRLGVKRPHTLTVQPADRCPKDFADTLSQHKRQLLGLLELPFLMAYSKTLGETIFFAEDENTKALLIEAGADSWSIYTRPELQVLVANNRAKPFIPDELIRLHATKRTFDAKIQNSFTDRGKRQCQQ